MISVSGILIHTIENEEIKGKKLNLNDLSFDIEPHPLPKGLIPSLIGLFFLLLSLFGSIMNLPSYLMLKEQSIYVKIVWKHIVMTSIFSPFMILDLATSDIFIIKVIVDNISSLITLSIISTLYNYLVYYAVTQTFVVHTLLLCSIATTFITTWKIARRLPFNRIEYIGIGFNVFGAYLCCCEGVEIPSINCIIK